MALTPSELERMPIQIEKYFNDLERRIMEDVVRRIQINSEITRAADWQIHRLNQLGMSKQAIELQIKNTLELSDKEIEKMYEQVVEFGYTRDKSIYTMAGKDFIPYNKNAELQQLVSAFSEQTKQTLSNITQSLGFTTPMGGKVLFTPMADFYQKTLDKAMLDITTGAFDYNSVLKRTVQEMTRSGVRTVEFGATNWSNRVEVASRRAVMSGITQVTNKINDSNAKTLNTEHFEVSWHATARPSHQVWQGRVFTKEELISVCGLDSITGLCGANCYHSYYPFIPGISERTYTDRQLTEMNAKENTKKAYGDKEFNAYEATQYQRNLETLMRKQRQDINLLEKGGASKDDIIAAKSRYRSTMAQYADFSSKMKLPQQKERIYMDGLGNVAGGKTVAKSKKNDKIEDEREITQRDMASGLRKSSNIPLSQADKEHLLKEMNSIGADEDIFIFRDGYGSGYSESRDKVFISSNVFPSKDSSLHPRDLMSERAVLAHEYYGHRQYKGTKVAAGMWNDEFRASYMAAKNCPNLSDFDRRYLILDALERAKEAGVTVKYNKFMRRVIYGD
jgi:hypothetical protein